MTKIYLKEGRDAALLGGHPWIFSGAIRDVQGKSEPGFAEIYSAKGKLLGQGMYNPRTSIALRVTSRELLPPDQYFASALQSAVAFRDQFLDPSITARRLVNAEGDNIPGLIVDQYGDLLVLQVSTAVTDAWKQSIVASLVHLTKATAVYERSDSSSREEEGLAPVLGFLSGEIQSPLRASEYAIRFEVDFIEGQKTGFFIDQREMRLLVQQLSNGKNVLNCFSYSGGFSLAALKGGASRVVSVDSSAPALEICNRNVALNGFDETLHEAKCVNAFDYLGGTHEKFDLAIVDPPAFAKRREHISQARKAYLQINKSAFRLVKPGGVLISSSCSNYIDRELFESIIHDAARESGRTVSVLGQHRHGLDHPVLLGHREGSYLKSLILLVK